MNMLDANIKIEKKEAKEFLPLPENIYQVELLDIDSKDVETYNSKMGKTDGKEFEKVLSFQFTLLAGKDKGETLRGRNVWVNFVPTTLFIGKKGKNNLYQIVESLLGRELSPQEEAEGIDGAFLNALVGKQCRIATKHKKSKDGSKTFDNVATYYPAEMELPSLTNEEKDTARVKDKKDKEADSTYDSMSEEEIEEVTPF